jgi:hypothetical protein
MHKNATKCNKTQSKWCVNKHGASKIIDTFETYHTPCTPYQIESTDARHRNGNQGRHDHSGHDHGSSPSPSFVSGLSKRTLVEAMKVLAEVEENQRKRKAATPKATLSLVVHTMSLATLMPRRPVCATTTTATEVHAHQVLDEMREMKKNLLGRNDFVGH